MNAQNIINTWNLTLICYNGRIIKKFGVVTRANVTTISQNFANNFQTNYIHHGQKLKWGIQKCMAQTHPIQPQIRPQQHPQQSSCQISPNYNDTIFKVHTKSPTPPLSKNKYWLETMNFKAFLQTINDSKHLNTPENKNIRKEANISTHSAKYVETLDGRIILSQCIFACKTICLHHIFSYKLPQCLLKGARTSAYGCASAHVYTHVVTNEQANRTKLNCCYDKHQSY